MKEIILTFTTRQVGKLLKYLYIACDKARVDLRKDKELKDLVETLQSEYYNKTGRWWV